MTMKHYRMLKGDKLYLSPISAENTHAYCEWTNDLEIMIQLGISGNPNSEASQHQILQSMEKGNNFAIVTNDDQLIGNCSLYTNPIYRSATLGIFIGDKDYQSKGYGREAVSLLCQYGFDILNLHNIQLVVYSFNQRAVKAYEAVGFKQTGKRHESYYLKGRYYDEIYMEILPHDLKINPLDQVLSTIV